MNKVFTLLAEIILGRFNPFFPKRIKKYGIKFKIYERKIYPISTDVSTTYKYLVSFRYDGTLHFLTIYYSGYLSKRYPEVVVGDGTLTPPSMVISSECYDVGTKYEDVIKYAMAYLYVNVNTVSNFINLKKNKGYKSFIKKMNRKDRLSKLV